jgi:hypothetical protein
LRRGNLAAQVSLRGAFCRGNLLFHAVIASKAPALCSFGVTISLLKCHCEGSVLLPECSVLLPECSVLLPECSVLLPECSVLLPECSVLLPEAISSFILQLKIFVHPCLSLVNFKPSFPSPQSEIKNPKSKISLPTSFSSHPNL